MRLYEALQEGPPALPTWLDIRDVALGQDWDAQILEAIRTCSVLLYVITRESMGSQEQEWMYALKHKKTIIPLLVHPDAEVPLRLSGHQSIDFTGVIK